MIVKNEAHVVQRCLASVKHLIDSWVIVDTGSSDGTQEIIKDALKDIPGEIYERPWKNFGENRNEALQLAENKADYLLFIDADDVLELDDSFVLPDLSADLYSVLQKEGTQTAREHHVCFLAKNQCFSWRGVVHEYLQAARLPISRELLKGAKILYINDGNRSKDPNKVQGDIKLLLREIESDPTDCRSIFYLARSYWSIYDGLMAMRYFAKRAEMGGDPLEVYHSLLYFAIAQKNLNLGPEIFLDSLCRAHLYRPTRAEAIYEMIRHYAETQSYYLGYLLAKTAIDIPMTTDNLFVESWVYDWGVPLYFYVCATQVGATDEAKEMSRQLAKNPRMPDAIRERFGLLKDLHPKGTV